nr:hypothetical protein [Tanacetum cinerariifolium]
RDESSDSDSEPEAEEADDEPKAEDADDELEIEEAGVEPEAEGDRRLRLKKKWRERNTHYDLIYVVTGIMPPKPMSEARMREIIRDQFATSMN